MFIVNFGSKSLGDCNVTVIELQLDKSGMIWMNMILRWTFIIGLLFAITNCQSQTIRDSHNMLICKIESSGIVRDKNNMMIGKIESDGKDKHNMLVGKIETNGTVRDKNNMTIGKVESDGTVRDRNNMMVGKVRSDGIVLDRNNMSIGYAEDISTRHVAVFFFFNMFK